MDAETALHALMTEFVRRIPLVLEVIEARHPDFLVVLAELPKEELTELLETYAHVPQQGIWTNIEGEWEHVFHGRGCRLTHRVTREVIDWNPPDTNHLDLWKFRSWLDWAVRTEPSHLAASIRVIRPYLQGDTQISTFLQTTTDSLITQGKLVGTNQGATIKVITS